MDVSGQIDMLRRLSDTDAVAGFEDGIQQVIREMLPERCVFRRDRMGNLFAVLRGSSDEPNVLLTAHVDEIGFLVTGVTEAGFLRFRPLGTWSPGGLPGQRVTVHGRHGPLPGVIASLPPHVDTSDRKQLRIDDMFIDVGARDPAEVSRSGVRVGSPATPKTASEVTADGRSIIGKAWDDRVGVGLMIATLQAAAARGGHPNTITAAATVQEELGSRGARAMAEAREVRPDVAFVFEGILTRDLPGAGERGEWGSSLDRGPNIVVHDDAMLAHPRLLEWVLDVAQREEIQIQLTPAFGSNDANSVHLMHGGTPTLVIGVPCRYIHSHNGLVRISDFVEATRLMGAVIDRLDRSAVALITEP
jgi:putative aminopeptidase FrvX